MLVASYTTYGTLLKLGASYRWDNLSIGLTITTPNLRLFGTGSASSNRFFVNADSSELISSAQLDLPATYKRPLSVGAGAGWTLSKVRLHASAEWFSSLDTYNVMKGAEFNAIKPADQSSQLEVEHATSAILNWGSGIEYRMSASFTGYLSFYRDHSSRVAGEFASAVAIMPIDINNLTLGSNFRVGRVLLTLGGGFGWGRASAVGLNELLQVRIPDFEADYVFRNLFLLFGIEIAAKQN